MMKKALLLAFIFITATLYGQVTPDTLVVDGITIIRDNTAPVEQKKGKRIFKKISTQRTPKGRVTEWGVVDVGFSNFADNTNYSGTAAQTFAPGSNKEWFKLKPFRSRNINIWVVTQQYNLIKHIVNLKYGIGLELNNYFFKQPITYNNQPPAITDPPIVFIDERATMMSPERIFKKNKLAVDYITVPLLFNFNFTPSRLYPFQLSTGVSVGYLYGARNKTITSDDIKDKVKGDFDLDTWKLSYLGDITLGIVTLYSSYAFKTMYRRGLDQTPYTVGIRLRPADILNKIEAR